MPTLQSLIGHSPRNSPNLEEIIYEIHYRVPRKLQAPFVASHFTLVRHSGEDRYFEQVSDRVRNDFAHNTSPELHAVILPPHIYWQDLIRRDNLDAALNEHSGNVESFGSRADAIMLELLGAYQEVLQKNAALFVFNALDHILDWIARRVTDKFGDDWVLDIVFKDFCRRFGLIFKVKMTKIYAELEKSGDYQHDYESADFGSVRRWLLDNRYMGPLGQFGRDFDDFQHYEAAYSPADGYPLTQLSHQIRWSRAPQGWNYTFIEMPREDQPVAHQFRIFTDLVLTSVLDPSVMNSRRFPEIPTKHHFPGRFLAGAHYLLLRIEDLLAFSIGTPESLGLGSGLDFDAQMIWNRVRAFRKHPAPGPDPAADIAISLSQNLSCRRRLVSRLVEKCLDLLGAEAVVRLSGARNIGQTLRIEITQILANGNPVSHRGMAEQLVQTISEAPALTEDHEIRLFLGDMVREIVNSPDIREPAKAQLYRCVSDIIRSFWNSTYRTTVEGPARDVPDDFVSSSMVEGRCIYFSNFMPFGTENFTRTIFVDIDLSNYQRARMLQRLGDILIYRSIPIRDLDRVKSAIEALNDLNRRLSDIQMRVLSEGQPARQMRAVGVQSPREQVEELRREMNAILDVSVQTGRLNAFFTYGIVGKWSSTSAYFEQILERCEDLREERIPSYPKLAEFVERRLRYSIRYVERMHMHYATVGQRTSELLDRVRTELNVLQTENVVRDVHEQLNLTQVAEILILLAGSYYAFGLLKPFNEGILSNWKLAEWLLVVLSVLSLILGKFVYRRVCLRRAEARQKAHINAGESM